jgi:preprotein translocase subunit SecD
MTGHMLLRSFIAIVLTLPGVAMAADSSQFTIAGEAFPQSEIVDARALPQLDGSAALMLTFEGASVDRIARISRAHVGKSVSLALNGRTLCEPVIREVITVGEMVVVCGAGPLDAIAALAKVISGKDPLPDSLDEGP